MMRIGSENPAKHRFCLRQPPRLMLCHRDIQGLLDGDRSHVDQLARAGGSGSRSRFPMRTQRGQLPGDTLHH